MQAGHLFGLKEELHSREESSLLQGLEGLQLILLRKLEIVRVREHTRTHRNPKCGEAMSFRPRVLLEEKTPLDREAQTWECRENGMRVRVREGCMCEILSRA